MQTLFIERVHHNGNIIIKTNYNNKNIYIGYSLRNAISLFRNKNGLRGKKLEIITK